MLYELSTVEIVVAEKVVRTDCAAYFVQAVSIGKNLKEKHKGSIAVIRYFKFQGQGLGQTPYKLLKTEIH